jgi:hypothetical protein
VGVPYNLMDAKRLRVESKKHYFGSGTSSSGLTSELGRAIVGSGGWLSLMSKAFSSAPTAICTVSPSLHEAVSIALIFEGQGGDIPNGTPK